MKNKINFNNFLIIILILLLKNTYAKKDYTITDVYNIYLSGNYKKSENLYLKLYEKNPNQKDPVYGIVNSLMAQKKYKKALKWANNLLTNDKIMTEKKLYIYAAMDKSNIVDSLYSEFKKKYTLNTVQMGTVENTIAWYFYNNNSKYYKKWFALSKEKIPEIIIPKEQAKNKNSSLNVNLMGGKILYSDKTIYPNKEDSSLVNYKITGGLYIQEDAYLLIKKHSKISILASQFQTNSKIKTKVISLQTKKTGINYIDTLYSLLDEKPNSDDTYFEGTYFDTIADTNATYYVTYEHVSSNSEKADTLVDTFFTDTTVKHNDSLNYQNNIYLSYELFSPNNRNFSLGIGFNYTMTSNVPGMTGSSMLFWLKNGHSLPFMDVVFNWYYTKTVELKFLQITPDFYRGFFKNKVILKLSPTYIWKIQDKDDFDIPFGQFSINPTISFINNFIAITGGASWGRQSFIAGNNGKTQLSIIFPHKFSGTLSIGLTPFKKKTVTIYALGIYEQFDVIDRMIISGGLNLNF